MRIVPRLVVIVVVLVMSVMVALPVSAAPRNASNLPQAPCQTPVPGQHCVQPGEWIYCIARAYQVSPWAIAQVNGIPGPYGPYNPYYGYYNPYYSYYSYYYPYYSPWNYIYPGQRLTIPAVPWYNIPAGQACAKQATVTLPSPWPPPQPTPVPYPVPAPY